MQSLCFSIAKATQRDYTIPSTKLHPSFARTPERDGATVPELLLHPLHLLI